MSFRIILVAFISLLLLLQAKESLGEGCKNMVYLLEKDGYSLRNHTVENLTDVTKDICQISCYMNDFCLSYNYCTRSGTCEINDSDEYIHPHDLIRKAGSVFVGTKNACSRKPCPTNSTCKPNFYTEGFSCLCPPGFSGSKCSDIDECASEAHNCFDGSTCFNTQGSFECRCEAGYRKFEGKCIRTLADYEITVYTGDKFGAGTNAKVFIQLHGSHFGEAKTSLKEELSGHFERNDIDRSMEKGVLPNMESLSEITMSHDNSGSFAAWYLREVIVDNQTRRMKYTFLCNCWLRTWGPTRDIQPTTDDSGQAIVTRY